jgi:hypothetical protein
MQSFIEAAESLMANKMRSGLTDLVIGLFFGLYPANQASILEAVEALRYEYPGMDLA